VLQRAYALFHVKAVDAEKRIIAGIATTPEPDRSGDIIEPLGVTFKNPLPLLLFHDAKKPVGVVKFKKPTADGIEFEASLPTVSDPGVLRDRIDEAWQSIKAGLVSGVSVGFRSIEDAFLKDSGGIHFLKTEVLELSLVTVPANASATIHTIKSLDLAASGLHSPGVTGLPVVHAVKAAKAMTIQEQITQFENTRAAKAAARDALMTKAAETGATLDAEQTGQYDELVLELKSIDAHLVRLTDLEKANVAAATKITAVAGQKAASDLRGAVPVISVKSNLAPGTGFTRYVQAIAATRGNKMEAIEYAKRWTDTTPEVELLLKAAVAAGTTTDATWAAPLVPSVQHLIDEFLGLLRPATILGKITNLRKVPFNVSVPTQTAGGSYGWVGQGAAKPVTKLAFGAVTLGMTKIAGIVVLTEELVRMSTPSAEQTVRNDMIAGIAQFMDTQFTDPAVAANGVISPASITNGTVAIVSSGPTAANAVTDIKALVATFVAANLGLGSAVLLMSEANAFALSTALNPLGQQMFPTVGTGGGTILGIPVVTSSAMGTNIVLVDASGILYADDGAVTIDVSREASVQMDSAPDSPAVATTVMVSLWQNNLVGIRAERFVNWARARLASVKYVSGAAYV
jgi:HK97 family phage major capsid protein/HK97 family phage prohead protease